MLSWVCSGNRGGDSHARPLSPHRRGQRAQMPALLPRSRGHTGRPRSSPQEFRTPHEGSRTRGSLPSHQEQEQNPQGSSPLPAVVLTPAVFRKAARRSSWHPHNHLLRLTTRMTHKGLHRREMGYILPRWYQRANSIQTRQRTSLELVKVCRASVPPVSKCPSR